MQPTDVFCYMLLQMTSTNPTGGYLVPSLVLYAIATCIKKTYSIVNYIRTLILLWYSYIWPLSVFTEMFNSYRISSGLFSNHKFSYKCLKVDSGGFIFEVSIFRSSYATR